jgi:hypothetical protein
MTLNQAARRLDVAWLDAGVQADGQLARVSLFAPGADAACLECGWGDTEYAAVEQIYACPAGSPAVAPTAAPSSLGALAASLQAIECEKWLTGDRDHALAGRELLVDARHHVQYVTLARRNAACRMPDHDAWPITPLDVRDVATVADLVRVGSAAPGGAGDLEIGVAGQLLALAVGCAACGRSRPTLRLERTLRHARRRCWRCGRALQPAVIELRDVVPARTLPPAALALRLAAVGLRGGDVVVFSTPSANRYVELTGGRQ